MTAHFKANDPSVVNNRRDEARTSLHKGFRFVFEENKKEKLFSAISQNASKNGLNVLSSNLLCASQVLELYFPIQTLIIPIRAQVMWSQVESNLADSPYWLSAGLRLYFLSKHHQKLMHEQILKP